MTRCCCVRAVTVLTFRFYQRQMKQGADGHQTKFPASGRGRKKPSRPSDLQVSTRSQNGMSDSVRPSPSRRPEVCRAQRRDESQQQRRQVLISLTTALIVLSAICSGPKRGRLFVVRSSLCRWRQTYLRRCRGLVSSYTMYQSWCGIG